MLSHRHFKIANTDIRIWKKINIKKIHIFILKRLDPTHTFTYLPLWKLNWVICYFVDKKNFYTRKSQSCPKRDAVKQSLSHTTYTVLWKNTHSIYERGKWENPTTVVHELWWNYNILLWINTYSLSYSLTSTFRGCETQWMKALGFSPTDVGSHFTSSSTTVPSESFNTLVTEMR